MTLLLTAADVAELLTLDDCIAAVEDAFRAHGEGRLAASGVLSAHAERGAFHIKTAFGGGYFVAKTNANFPPSETERQAGARVLRPTVQGVVLLFDANNGTPLAVMDSIEITVRRTGAATAVAAKYLARPESHVVEVYGCGRQGQVQLEAVSRVLRIDAVVAHDVNEETLRRFSQRWPMSENAIADVIVTCTTSKKAFLSDARPGTFIAAVGADNPEKSEIAPELMRSSTIVTDVTEQATAIGDLHHAPGAAVDAELGEVVAGRKPGRRSADEVIIFDSTGVGFQDAAAASIVYQRAIERGRGTSIQFA